VFGASVLVFLAFIALTIQLTFSSNLASSSDPSMGDVMKLLALFLQYVGIIGSLPVVWPASLLNFMSAADWVFGASAGLSWASSPFECLLHGTAVQPAVLKALVFICMPIAVVCIEALLFFGVVYACGCRATGSHRQSRRQGRLPVIVLVSMFFTFPIWLRAVFSFFGCYSVEDPGLLHTLKWVQDMAQACYLGYHRAWSLGLGVPCLILCCAAPVALCLGLWLSRSRLSSRSFRERYGSVYRLYAGHAYWWKAVILSQTMLLVALSVFSAQIGSYASVLLAGLVIALSIQLLQSVRPYAARMLHRIHLGTLWCLLVNVFVALLMFTQPQSSPAKARALARGQVAAAALAVMLNACFLLACCACVVVCFLRSPTRAKVSGILGKLCGNLGVKCAPTTPLST